MTQGLTDGEETVVKIDEIKVLSGNTPTKTGSMYAWNQEGGVIASSTGNMTGIYDLSGGVWERTTAYIANESDILQDFGESVVYSNNIKKTMSTKYTTVYPYDNIMDNTEENIMDIMNANYSKNTKIYGDAIRETSSEGSDSTSWENDKSEFPAQHAPFIDRGGRLWVENNAGRFFFGKNNGASGFSEGFRSVVIPIS